MLRAKIVLPKFSSSMPLTLPFRIAHELERITRHWVNERQFAFRDHPDAGRSGDQLATVIHELQQETGNDLI